MTLPFYKLQVAGNGFILCDFLQIKESEMSPEEFARTDWSTTAKKICNKRFGVGASGCVFLGANNSLRFYNARGLLVDSADDALLCAARYAFDSGKTDGKKIVFHVPAMPGAADSSGTDNARGTHEKTLCVDIFGANEFRISCGTPYSLLKGETLAPHSKGITEIIEHDGLESTYAALSLHDDVLVSSPHSRGHLSLQALSDLTRKAFPQKNVLPAIAAPVTDDTIVARTVPRGMSGICAAAAASLCALRCAGATDFQTMVLFCQPGDDGTPDTILEEDTDASRRLAVFWDYKENGTNEVFAVGSGAYVFEGKFDIQEAYA